MNAKNYKSKAAEIAAKYPKTNAQFQVSKFGGRYEIEVATVNQAKALCEMFTKFTFTSESYR